MIHKKTKIIATIGPVSESEQMLEKLISLGIDGARLNFSISFLAVFTGFFLMVFRLKALAQIIGLLVMENGVFMLASSISGGMPFIVEIAVFFDLFVLVVVAGIFVYRIKGLFTHIDVSRLTRLKG